MDFGLSSTPTLQLLSVNITPKKQRQLISQGMIRSVRQTEEYGRWEYTTVHGNRFLSTINPSRTFFSPGNSNI
jgi:tRNA-binding EMAP/Myf-like protein